MPLIVARYVHVARKISRKVYLVAQGTGKKEIGRRYAAVGCSKNRMFRDTAFSVVALLNKWTNDRAATAQSFL